MSYPPTGQQQAAIDAYLTGDDLVLEAGAGTGKTSTLRFLADAAPGARILYIAYNRAIADEAAASFPPNVTCKTAHSLAYQAIGKRYRNRLRAPRLKARQVAEILAELNPPAWAMGCEVLRPAGLARVVTDTVQRFCYSADRHVTPRHVPQVPGIRPDQDTAMSLACALLGASAWRDLQQPDGRLRFVHDHYLKMWALTDPELFVDVVMLDEAQDANPAVAGIVDAQRAQRVAVGDRCQAIYGWRGAVDAMSGWPWRRLVLSQSFRFGPAVADEANLWLSWLDAPLRLTGFERLDTRVGPLDGLPDAVLCRGNVSGLMRAVDLLDDGHAVGIVGGTDDVKRLAFAARDLQAGRATDHPELCGFDSWDDVREYAEEDPDGSDLATFVKLIDQRGPAFVLAIADEFVTEDRADVVVSTAHKAKGREWDAVQIGGDFPSPEPDDETGTEGQPFTDDDAMLAYVAVTRARKQLDTGSLGWIRDHQHEPDCRGLAA